MADIRKQGEVTAVCLKKCASSQMSRAMDVNKFPNTTRRYWTSVRNPAHRLVSAYQHLVGHRYKDERDPNVEHKFGPAVHFHKWLDWVTKHDPQTINAHFRQQTLELVDHLPDEDVPLMLVQTEQLANVSRTHLSAFLKTRIEVPHKGKRQYGAWQEHYTLPLLWEVQRVYRADYVLWHRLATGHLVTTCRALRGELTNA